MGYCHAQTVNAQRTEASVTVAVLKNTIRRFYYIVDQYRLDLELVCARLLQTLLPPVVMISAVTKIPVADLAVYYAAIPLMNGAALFELGISQQIIITTARHLAFNETTARGHEPGRALRNGLKQLSALCLSAIAGAGVASVYLDKQYVPFSVAVALAACLQLLLTLVYAVEEGCSRLREVARVRLVGSVLTSGMSTICIMSGCGITSYPLAALISGVVVMSIIWWGRGTREGLIKAARWISQHDARRSCPKKGDGWRYAVSTIAAYVSYQTPTLWLSQFLSAPEFAGWAMTSQVTTTIASMCFTPIQGQANVMAGYLAAGNKNSVKTFYKARFIFGTLMAISAGVVAYIVTPLADPTGRFAAVVLLPPLNAMVILVGSVLQFAGFSVGTLSRAFGRESQMEVAITHSICTTLFLVVIARAGDLFEIVTGIACVHAVVLVGGGFLVLKNQFRRIS